MSRTQSILFVAAVLCLAALVIPRQSSRPSAPSLSPSGPVQLSTLPSTRYLLARESGELFLDVSLAIRRPARRSQQPLNLALVVDRSGSMAGQKLEHARAAARTLVSRLREGDRIAIITYGSDVTVLVPSTQVSAATRVRIASAIDTIEDRGGTFLSGGLEAGRSEVQRSFSEGTLNRVVLISDGQANEGITAPEQLATLARQAAARGIHVSTMGVGLDFNENVMTAIAEHGGGHYYFIEDASSLARIFSDELATMLDAVASNPVLRMTLERGVELEEVYGYIYQRSGREVVIQLPDLFAGQDRHIVCRLRTTRTSEGPARLANLELQFDETGHVGQRRLVRAVAETVVTADERKAEAGRDPAVLARAEQARAAKTLTEAMEAYGSGDLARTQTLLEDQIKRTEAANTYLKSDGLRKLIDEAQDVRRRAAAAPPSSAAGRTLVKEGKFRAYQLAK